MGRAYKCDRCDSYFDGVSLSVRGRSPKPYSGIVLNAYADNTSGRILVDSNSDTHLCPDCAIEFANLFLEFMGKN